MKMCVRAGVKVLVVAAVVGAAGQAAAQTPATNSMTYQGKLQSGGQPYTGTADISIRVYNSDVGGSAIGLTNCWDHVQVQDGIFTLTFHPGSVLDGRALWLEIDVREDTTVGNGCTGAFTTLFPRQRIAAAPLASALVLPAYESASITGPALTITNAGNSDSAVALQGVSTATTANSVGVLGTNSSTGSGAIGVYGRISTPTPGAASVGVMGAVTVSGTSNGVGVYGVHMGTGTAVRGTSNGGTGVSGEGATGVMGYGADGASGGVGVIGRTFASGGIGVRGEHNAPTGTAPGVYGFTNSSDTQATGIAGYVLPTAPGVSSAAVRGINQGTNANGSGVEGLHMGTGEGVLGIGYNGTGVRGEGPLAGVVGEAWTNASASYGVRGTNSNVAGVGVKGEHSAATGTTPGVWGTTDSASGDAVGVLGEVVPLAPGSFSAGVKGLNRGTGGSGVGVYARHDGGGYGLYASVPTGGSGHAGWFNGRVQVTGALNVTGTLTKGSGSFKIDHPLDPENKYLYHSFVESPDMMNIYNGVATTDEKGYATVTMPDWFQALNQDFRYQLTVIDSADSDDFVLAKVVGEVEGNRFTLRASKGGVKVSWQVTGIRNDAFARDQRIPTEVLKSESERGMFLYPQGFGFGEERRVGRTQVEEATRQ